MAPWYNEFDLVDNKIVNGVYNYLLKTWLKLTETLLSVKVWGLISSLWVGTYLVINNYISGADFVSFITPIWTVIFGIREIWKVGRLFSTGKSKVVQKVKELTAQKEE